MGWKLGNMGWQLGIDDETVAVVPRTTGREVHCYNGYAAQTATCP